jgi:hypothetical protein
MVFHVGVDHKSTEISIHHFIRDISHYLHNIETRKDGVWEVDVISKAQRVVVSSLERVGGCNYAASCSQLGDDACFGDGDCLLLHCLVDWCSIVVVHLIELVNKAYSTICLDHGSCLESPFSCLMVLLDTCSQTDSWSSLTGRIHNSMEWLLDAL